MWVLGILTQVFILVCIRHFSDGTIPQHLKHSIEKQETLTMLVLSGWVVPGGP